MRKRPMCLACLGFMLVLVLLRIAGVPLGTPFSDPKYENKAQQGRKVWIAGTIETYEKKSSSSGYVLRGEGSKGKIYLLAKRGDLPVGAAVRVYGTVKKPESPRNPGMFDEKTYYEGKGCAFYVISEREEVVDAGRWNLGEALRLERERPLPARLGLRLRPEPDRSFHKAEATRFGMRTGELLDTAQELRLKGVREVGLSAMLGLGLRDPEAFSALARALFTCAAALHDSFGLQVSYCCLGGGLPVAHRRTERDADIAAVSRGVQAEFSRIMEPAGLGGVPVETGLGRWLTAHAGILLTTVTGVKRGAQDWLGVDVSRADLLRPELYGTYHHISVLGDDRVEGRRRYAVGDRIPEPREPFGQRLLPECRRGARLVLHDVGAYGASMGYSYGLTPHCAEYLYQADGTLRCIRRAQREDELFSTLDENPDFTAPAETPSGQAESQRPSEG